MIGMKLPFLNLSNTSKMLSNQSIGPIKLTSDNLSNVMGSTDEVYYISISKPSRPINSSIASSKIGNYDSQ